MKFTARSLKVWPLLLNSHCLAFNRWPHCWDTALRWRNFGEQNNLQLSPPPPLPTSPPFNVGMFVASYSSSNSGTTLLGGDGVGKLYFPLFMLAKCQKAPLGQNVSRNTRAVFFNNTLMHILISKRIWRTEICTFTDLKIATKLV